MTLSATIPEFRGLPLLGSMLDFRRDRLELLLRVSRRCGDIGIFRFGPWPTVLANSSEYVHAVLVEHADAFHKLPSIAFLRPLLVNGLLISEDHFWRRQRRLAAPAFQHRRVAVYADVMADYAERAQRSWAD